MSISFHCMEKRGVAEMVPVGAACVAGCRCRCPGGIAGRRFAAIPDLAWRCDHQHGGARGRCCAFKGGYQKHPCGRGGARAPETPPSVGDGPECSVGFDHMAA